MNQTVDTSFCKQDWNNDSYFKIDDEINNISISEISTVTKMIILDTTEPAFVVIVKGRKKFGTRLSDDFGTTTIASVGIFGYVRNLLA